MSMSPEAFAQGGDLALKVIAWHVWNSPVEAAVGAAREHIRALFGLEAMGKLAAKFTEYERTDSGTRVCPEDFETRSKEVAKIACLYADATMAEEERTRRET